MALRLVIVAVAVCVVLAPHAAALAAGADGCVAGLLLGDWGGQDTSPFTTTAQLDVAAVMRSTAAAIGANFVALMGGQSFWTLPSTSARRMQGSRLAGFDFCACHELTCFEFKPLPL